MPIPGRQIEGVRAETLVGELARVVIEQRLAAVVTCFPLAAEGVTDDRERVHQLRVATRRAVAAMRLFEDFCPHRSTSRLLRDLKRIRRAAGRARDIDVFLTRLANSSGATHQELLSALSQERQTAQQEIVDLFERFMESDRLTSRLKAVTARLRPRGRKAKGWGRKTIAQWAPRRLRKAIERFIEKAPNSFTHADELHPLRVEGKRLRYTLELLAAGLPAEDYERIYLSLEELQDRLGLINDHASAIDRLRAADIQDRAAIDQLVENEHADMQQEIEQAATWFRESFLPRLQSAIAAGDGSPPVAGPVVATSTRVQG